MNHLLPAVIPGQSSVRNGDAGRLAPLYKLQIGLSAHAYLTATGKATAGEDTTIVLPSITASAQ